MGRREGGRGWREGERDRGREEGGECVCERKSMYMYMYMYMYV